MLEPRDDPGPGIEPSRFALPSPPPGLSSRPARRSLRVLPCPEPAQRVPGELSPPEHAPDRGQLELRAELDAIRNELNALQDMLEELPGILERKFQQRLHGLLEHQRALIARNQTLREQVLALAPSAASPPRPQARTVGLVGGLRRSVRRALGGQAST